MRAARLDLLRFKSQEQEMLEVYHARKTEFEQCCGVNKVCYGMDGLRYINQQKQHSLKKKAHWWNRYYQIKYEQEE